MASATLWAKVYRNQHYNVRFKTTSSYGLNSLKFEKTLEPPKLEPIKKTHGDLVCNLELSGYMPDHLDFVSYFARYSGQQMRMPTSEVIHLQTKVAKWHVNKGPFVHAKSKEVFERKTYRRLVQVFDTHPSTVSQWIKYVNENLPSGVDMQVERFEWKPLDYSMKVPKIQEKKTHAQLILEEEANYLKKFQAA